VILTLGREVPCKSYSWERSSSQWFLLMGEKFLVALLLEKKPSVALTLRREVPCGSCSCERSSCESYSWERSSSQWLLLLGEKFLVNLTIEREVSSSGSCSWEKSSLWLYS